MPDRPVRLRLTPFEHYMLADDRRSHPMSFHLRFGVEGLLDLPRFERAVEAVASLHPLFTATVLRNRGRWFWNLGTATTRVAVHEWGGYPISRSDWYLDLRRETGLRISVAQEGEQAEIWLQVHHCCSDGRGCLDFMRDVLAAYEGDAPQHDSPSASKIQRQLAAREIGYSSAPWAYLWPLSKSWKRIWLYYLHPTQALSCTSTEPSSADQPFSLSYCSRKIPFQIEAWRKNRDAGSSHATLNDFLLYTVFKCLRQAPGWLEDANVLGRRRPTSKFWQRLLRRQHPPTGEATSHAWLRVAVPIDQRTSYETRSPASNGSSMVFLDRHTQQISNSKNLLPSISREMRTVKSHRLGSVLCDVLRVLNRIPGGIRLAAGGRRCAVTAVLSNLGELQGSLARRRGRSSSPQERTVGLKLDDLRVLVPLRPGTTLAMGVVMYREHLHLSLNYDNRQLPKDIATQLFDYLCNEAANACVVEK